MADNLGMPVGSIIVLILIITILCTFLYTMIRLNVFLDLKIRELRANIDYPSNKQNKS
jgi:hypothetical protein